MPAGTSPRRSPDPPADLATLIEFIQSGSPGPHAHVVLLGLRDFDSPALLRRVQRGLPFKSLERLQGNLAFSQAQLLDVVQIPQRTLTRRKQEGRFHADESDRLLRISRLFARALELFDGDAAAARQWLSTAQPALGKAVPLELAKTELGAREVEAAIARIEHGVFA